MFDGDLDMCIAEDDKDLICPNISAQPMHVSESLCYRSGVLMHDDDCNIPTAVTNNGKSSLFVAIPSQVSILANNHATQQTQQHNVTLAVENWDDDEAPELSFSDMASDENESVARNVQYPDMAN